MHIIAKCASSYKYNQVHFNAQPDGEWNGNHKTTTDKNKFDEKQIQNPLDSL